MYVMVFIFFYLLEEWDFFFRPKFLATFVDLANNIE